MDNSYIKNNLEEIFESFKEMIKVETVVGQAVHIDKMKKDKYIYIHDDDEDKTEGEDEKA